VSQTDHIVFSAHIFNNVGRQVCVLTHLFSSIFKYLFTCSSEGLANLMLPS
jgi:hypothetical protein